MVQEEIFKEFVESGDICGALNYVNDEAPRWIAQYLRGSYAAYPSFADDAVGFWFDAYVKMRQNLEETTIFLTNFTDGYLKRFKFHLIQTVHCLAENEKNRLKKLQFVIDDEEQNYALGIPAYSDFDKENINEKLRNFIKNTAGSPQS